MNNNLLLYTISIIVFLTYISFITYKYGTLPTISDSYYKLPDKFKFLFILFCWGFGLPIIILSETSLMFFAGGSIMFVGAAAAFKAKMTFNVHMFCAFSAVILGHLSILIEYRIWYVAPIFILLLLILISLRKKIKYFWWVEILAFITILIGLGIGKIF